MKQTSKRVKQVWSPIALVAMGVSLVAVLSIAAPFTLATPARADNIPAVNVTLWNTLDYNGRGFWGTAFFFQVVPSTDSNMNFDWYLIALKHNRADGGGDMDYFWSWLNLVDSSHKDVVSVDAKPVYHTPWSGGGSFFVGYGSAGVTINVESNGYDDGSTSTNPAYYGTFYWTHSFTPIDKSSWGYKDAAYIVKTQEVNGWSNSIYGVFSVKYQWSVWDWGCFCTRATVGWANYPHGNVVYYTDNGAP